MNFAQEKQGSQRPPLIFVCVPPVGGARVDDGAALYFGLTCNAGNELLACRVHLWGMRHARPFLARPPLVVCVRLGSVGPGVDREQSQDRHRLRRQAHQDLRRGNGQWVSPSRGRPPSKPCCIRCRSPRGKPRARQRAFFLPCCFTEGTCLFPTIGREKDTFVGLGVHVRTCGREKESGLRISRRKISGCMLYGNWQRVNEPHPFSSS